LDCPKDESDIVPFQYQRLEQFVEISGTGIVVAYWFPFLGVFLTVTPAETMIVPTEPTVETKLIAIMMLC
jgi:hypothetical protein